MIALVQSTEVSLSSLYVTFNHLDGHLLLLGILCSTLSSHRFVYSNQASQKWDCKCCKTTWHQEPLLLWSTFLNYVLYCSIFRPEQIMSLTSYLRLDSWGHEYVRSVLPSYRRWSLRNRSSGRNSSQLYYQTGGWCILASKYEFKVFSSERFETLWIEVVHWICWPTSPIGQLFCWQGWLLATILSKTDRTVASAST